jgi:hypothetical protein
MRCIIQLLAIQLLAVSVFSIARRFGLHRFASIRWLENCTSCSEYRTSPERFNRLQKIKKALFFRAKSMPI